jgi:hypothetical protein
MTQVKQVRFYGYGNPMNYPNNLTYNSLVNGTAFLGEGEKAKRVGI